MKLIAHRGNTGGRLEHWENEPTYIDLAIKKGFDVEVDVWFKDGMLFLGHDKPLYGMSFKWFHDRVTNLWVHCKNKEAAIYFNTLDYKFNYFWHENDFMTLTSYNIMWVYPGNQPIKNSIAVMPELNDDNISECLGICSDNVEKYKI